MENYEAKKKKEEEEEEGIPTFCNSMDGTGDYHTKWNKSISER